MQGVKKCIINEVSGWKFLEILWLCVACFSIISISILWKDSMMGIISASTGVIAAICTGKGKLSAYIFGFINTVLYAIISYNAKYYGEVMLNVMYFLPLQFYGFYVWSKHMNAETKEVRKRKMTWKQFMLLVAIVSAATVLYGMFLSASGGRFLMWTPLAPLFR
ncbi:MAG: nicotinamide riboside transporter PnuC [Bradymonadales bacterium]|jgi:nicotinamide mononucleotide transporter